MRAAGTGRQVSGAQCRAAERLERATVTQRLLLQDLHQDGHKPGQHGMTGPHHGPGQGRGPQQAQGSLRDRLMNRVRGDHTDQAMLDHEDGLTDKDLYHGQGQGQQGPHGSIPAIVSVMMMMMMMMINMALGLTALCQSGSVT
ncbi:hypothetical protein E2C01_045805 [Portunus trituberculatus]|uniref:Uncharacterized protein n=1 Tax=Portunus trituberculatus TaxID=210409 RepID=A0A5B7G307_PORTR|nr:hypothetical protein [Portunus trituberculatus]